MADNVDGDEDGGFFEGVVDDGSKAFSTNPNQWTEKQTIGVAVGGAVAFVLLLIMIWCCQKFRNYCRYKLNKRTVNPRHRLSKPYVLRRGARSSQYVLNSQNQLPLGCTLHGAEKLHAAGLDGLGVRVAVIDTGIDKQHPDLEGRVVRQEWYRSGTPLALDDHGTHVAGTIHFMAPKANIYDFRVIGKEGEIDSDKAVAEAIRDAVAEGCQIINISIRISYPVVRDVRKAVKYAHRKGVIMVCATGNYPGDEDPTINHRLTYPAKWSQTISVSAVKKVLGAPVASFSDVVASGTGFHTGDFAAVGQDIVSLKPGGGYQIMSGTSVAAPHVTGMLAAMMTGGGDVKKRAKKLVAELKSTYALDVTAKGSDNNTTQIGLPTFLTKWEFDKFWRRYSSGMVTTSAHERPTLERSYSSRTNLERDSQRNVMKGMRGSSRNLNERTGSSRNLNERPSLERNYSSRTNLERDSQRNVMKGMRGSFRNLKPEESPSVARRGTPPKGRTSRRESWAEAGRESSSSRDMSGNKVWRSSPSGTNGRPSSLNQLPTRLSGNGRPVLSRRSESWSGRESSFRTTGSGSTGRSPSSGTNAPRRPSGNGRESSFRNVNSSHTGRSPPSGTPRRLSGNGRPVINRDRSSGQLNAGRKPPEKGRRRSRSINGRTPVRAR